MSGQDQEPDAKPESAGIGAAVQEVSDRAVRLVQDEIALAKAELSEKFSKLVRGVVIGAVVAVFLFWAIAIALFGFVYLAWRLGLGGDGDLYLSFFLVAGVLIVLALIGGMLAFRAFKAATPPVPTKAIDEAQKIKATIVPEDAKLPYAPPVYKAASASDDGAADPAPDEQGTVR